MNKRRSIKKVDDSNVEAYLRDLDRELDKDLSAATGPDLRPGPDEDPFTRQLMDEERAFLNPGEWGIDMRPVFREQLNNPESAGDLSDPEIRGYLRWMVLILAQHHLCLTSTNHLSDRELYDFIMQKVLPQPIGVGPSPVGSLVYHECCPCDGNDYLAFYADDLMREEFKSMFDEDPPEKLPLVSDRDLWLETLAESFRDEPLPQYEQDEP